MPPPAYQPSLRDAPLKPEPGGLQTLVMVEQGAPFRFADAQPPVASRGAAPP
jgi:hypothetical protein